MFSRVFRSNAKLSRLMNILFLIGGFGLGQGSIFLAQTWLVAHGRLDLLALFGTHFSFSMFGIMLVEAGSITILARKVASMSDDETADVAWQAFCETSVVRVALACLTAAFAIGSLHFIPSNDFTLAFVWYSVPAYLLWSINAAGMLDGLKLSGVSGLSGSISYLASAIALFLARDASMYEAGVILGCAFTAGFLLTIGVQYLALWRSGWTPRFVAPRRQGVLEAALAGLSMLGGSLPGQVYFRAQLVISSTWLGVDTTAIFVYVKQIVSAFTQVVGFVRRVEFPELVKHLSKTAAHPLVAIFKAQRLGTLLGLAGAFASAVAGLVMASLGQGVTGQIGLALAIFSVTIFSSTIALSMNQGLAAQGRFTTLMLVSLLALAAGLSSSFVFVAVIGIAAFALGDFLANLSGIATAIATLRKSKRRA